MKLNAISILQPLACLAALSFLLSGCGGAGSTTGGGGGSTNFTAAFSYSGFGGESVAAVGASSMPQDVQVRVNGVVRTVQDAFVPKDILSGSRVSVLSKGTRIINATVDNPSIGLIFDNSTVHPPVSADGVLQADVITRSGVLFRTPPLTWQGRSLPNGLTVLFSASTEDGDVSGNINASVNMPDNAGAATGSTTFTYSSLRNTNSVRFALETANASRIDVNDATHVDGSGSLNGSVTVPWRCYRAAPGSALDSWPTALLSIGFSN